jgi:hypothetical protein
VLFIESLGLRRGLPAEVSLTAEASKVVVLAAMVRIWRNQSRRLLISVVLLEGNVSEMLNKKKKIVVCRE